MIVFPNGKINLGLSVISKRNDGFHNIESIVYPVPVFDVLEFYKSKQLSLKVYGMEIPGEKSENTVLKAWHALHQDYNLPPVEIKLLKGIPVGSGLGGGSSDAAFLLKGLNSYFNLNLSASKLKEYAASIGSDCPFFIENKAALIKGRGDVVEQIELSLKGYHIVVISPDFQVTTQEAYGNIIPGHKQLSIGNTIGKPISEWQGLLVNDFEKITFEKHPQLKNIKSTLLKEGALYASLTGSGSAVYALFKDTSGIDTCFPDCKIWHGLLT